MTQLQSDASPGAIEATAATDGQVTIIEPFRPGIGARLSESWRHRRLLGFFARRALEKIYARTVLGRAWLVLRPLMQVLPAVLIFGGVLGAPSEGLPYFLFFVVGMAAWTIFERSLYWATRGIELNRRLITKLYFPRLLLPVASIAPGLVEVALYTFLIAGAVCFYQVTDGTLHLDVGWNLLAAPAALGLALALALGLGLWTSVIGARARDMRYSLQIVLAFWFLFTPVIYPLSAVPERFQDLAAANPLTPLVEMFRWALVGTGQVETAPLLACIALIAAACVSGLWYFDRAEVSSVDRL
jgi:lipopolysaccharide transport system permease protein